MHGGPPLEAFCALRGLVWSLHKQACGGAFDWHSKEVAMLHNQLSKKLVITAGLVVAMGAFGATLGAAEQARNRTPSSVSKGSQSGSSSGRTAVPRSSGGHSRGQAGATRSGSVERNRSRDGGRHYRGRGYRNYGYRFGLGYYGGWGGFYGGYGGFYYSPFYYGYPVYYSHHPARYSDFGALDINVRPKKTEVWVDGQYVGTAGRFDGYPGHLWLGEGRHELIFYKQGFVTVRREVKVLEGVVLDIAHQMVPGASVPAEELTAFSLQELRPIEEDRAYRERSSRSDEDREPALAPRMPRAGDRRPMRNDVRAEPGRLVLDVFPDDASIYLDGRFLGSGAELVRLHSGLVVSPGEHTLEVVRPGFDSQEIVFSVGSGDETSLRVDLEEAGG